MLEREDITIRSSKLVGLDYDPTITAEGQKSDHLSINFREWHVEALLNQAADLLDRCLKDRSEYDALRVQSDIQEISLSQDEAANSIDIERNVAHWVHFEDKLMEKELLNSSMDGNYTNRDYHAARYYNESKNLEQVEAGKQKSEADISTKRYGFEKAFDIKHHAWETNDKEFRDRQLTNTKSSNKKRRDLIIEEEGSLNYKYRFDVIWNRMERDFEDAYDRIIVASKGLQNIYGYNITPPATSNILEHKTTPIDSCIDWVREAIKWLIAFGQLDQGWTCIVSVRNCVSDEAWVSALLKKDILKFIFSVPQSLFSKHTYVRVRGISAFAVCDSSITSPWTGSVTLPKNAISFHLPDIEKNSIKKNCQPAI